MKISARGLARNRSPDLRAAWDQTTAEGQPYRDGRARGAQGGGGRSAAQPWAARWGCSRLHHALPRRGASWRARGAGGMRGWVSRGRANRATAPYRAFWSQLGGGTGGEEAQLPIGPVSVGPTAVEVLHPVMVQVAALAQRGQVEQGRRSRGAVVDVRRRQDHAAARDWVGLMIASAAPLTPIPGPHHAHEPGPHGPIQGIPAPHVPRRVVHFSLSGFWLAA